MAPASAKVPSVSRLQLCERSETSDAVDGAWWPRSRDLNAELPDLVAVSALWLGPVRRVLYDPSQWNPASSRIIKGGSVITVDPYRMVAADTIYLVGTHARHSLLFVVPPALPKQAAARLLRTVTDASSVGVGLLRGLLAERQRAADSP